jgi:hypothetical protein
VGGRIKLDLDLIGDLAKDLAGLHSDFVHVSSAADDYRSGIGSTVVSGAIGEFAGNWGIRRKRLEESIQAVAQMAESAHENFTKVEIGLANRILGKGDH